MSALTITSLLVTALGAISPTLATQQENAPYEPVNGTPYQRVHLLLAEPAPVEASGRVNREQGYLQVTLCYPLGTGSGDALARAELIRAALYRGRTLTSGAVTVTIERTPEISPAMIDDDRYSLPVKIRFYSYITRG